jgi:tRNA-guanine transglycosylase
MINFKVLKKSQHSQARLGLLTTSHGEVETPCLVPVATQATVKTLTSEEVLQTKAKLLISNTFYLHQKPGEGLVKAAGGLHCFMNWSGSLMTDSGGFQVFSLGFGTDLGTTKIAKSKSRSEIVVGQQPKLIKITDQGVHFTSYLDGAKLFLGPRESIKIQQDLGADIIFAFDECPPPHATQDYMKKSLERTHKWAKLCLKHKTSEQALFGIVQGGRFKNLRTISAQYIASLPFDGFGIGGEFGANKATMEKMIGWVVQNLPPSKPRHLLGIGYVEDISRLIKSGVDTFDCIVPTHYARRGIAFTATGRLDMNKAKFLRDKSPLDKKCHCFVCRGYKRNYITHLLRAKEITALKLLTFHNLYFFNAVVENYRKLIKQGKL